MKTVYVKCGPNESTHVVIKGVVGAKTKFVKEVLITDLLPSEWISVEDRLPSKGDVVMVYREAGTIPGSFYIDTGAYGFYVDEVWGDRENDNWNVTYWMPLPEPPVQQLNEKR